VPFIVRQDGVFESVSDSHYAAVVEMRTQPGERRGGKARSLLSDETLVW